MTSELHKVCNGSIEVTTNAEVFVINLNLVEKCYNTPGAWTQVVKKHYEKFGVLFDYQENEAIISVKGLSDRKINYLKKMLPDVQFDLMKLTKSENSPNLISVFNFFKRDCCT